MKFKLGIIIDVIWFIVILGMLMYNAYSHSWLALLWLLIFFIHCLYLVKDYSNVTVVNKIYNIDKDEL